MYYELKHSEKEQANVQIAAEDFTK